MKHTHNLLGGPLLHSSTLHGFHDIHQCWGAQDIHTHVLVDKQLHDAFLDLRHWQVHFLLHVPPALPPQCELDFRSLGAMQWDANLPRKLNGLNGLPFSSSETKTSRDNMLTGVFSSTTRTVSGSQLVREKVSIALLF